MGLIAVRPVPPDEIAAAALVIARGMADNPHHLRDFGATSARRAALCERLYLTVLPLIRRHGTVLGAYQDGAIVGALGATGPGQCRPAVGVQARLAITFLARLGPRRALRTLRWMKARLAYDPCEPHWHLGPVAVDPSKQGQGIGTSLMRDFCRRISGVPPGSPVFLETESSRNVHFYERFGFSTVGELAVLGVPTWIMMRHEVVGPADAQILKDVKGHTDPRQPPRTCADV